jgi:hypothetical protein
MYVYPLPLLIAKVYENTGDGGIVLAQVCEKRALTGAAWGQTGRLSGLQDIEKERFTAA